MVKVEIYTTNNIFGVVVRAVGIDEISGRITRILGPSSTEGNGVFYFVEPGACLVV
jgi:hypothetical protein